MSIRNYAKKLGYEQGNSPMVGWPSPVKAQAQYYTDNVAASSVITLTDSTTQVEVKATGSDFLVRWVPVGDAAAGSVTTANYDHIVPSGTFRQFVVPVETAGVTSIVGINVQAGLYKRIAVNKINAASNVASVLTSEY